MLRSGEWKLAKDIKINDSLMPLYKKIKKSGKYSNYELIYHPKSTKGSWQPTHRMVAEHKWSDKKLNHKQIHHNDDSSGIFNLLNNLRWLLLAYLLVLRIFHIRYL